MSSILREFYLGNVNPMDRVNPESKIYKEYSKEARRLESEITGKLSEEGIKIFNEYIDLCTDISLEENCAVFVEGFTLGSLFILEVFQKGERYTNL